MIIPVFIPIRGKFPNFFKKSFSFAFEQTMWKNSEMRGHLLGGGGKWGREKANLIKNSSLNLLIKPQFVFPLNYPYETFEVRPRRRGISFQSLDDRPAG